MTTDDVLVATLTIYGRGTSCTINSSARHYSTAESEVDTMRGTFKPALPTVITIITTQSADGLIPFKVSATKARQSRAARVTPVCFRGGLPRNPLAETLQLVGCTKYKQLSINARYNMPSTPQQNGATDSV